MSEAAAARMQSYCSEQSVYEKLVRFLQQTATRPVPEGAASDRPVAAVARLMLDQEGKAIWSPGGLDLENAKLFG